jgi:hypothetical protein
LQCYATGGTVGKLTGTLGFIILAILLSSRADAAPIAAGDIVALQVTQTDGSEINRFQGGGPFRMDLPGTAPDLIAFCLQISETFEAGEALKIGSISDHVVGGGASGTDDPISGTTAFLYTQLSVGNTAYLNGQVMQEAIWFLEDEISSASLAALALITLAQTDMARLGWSDTDLGNVRVAGMFRGADFNTPTQDMLVMVTVPEPASVLLLGIGIAVLGRFRTRRLSKA